MRQKLEPSRCIFGMAMQMGNAEADENYNLLREHTQDEKSQVVVISQIRK
jgi:hypothetical protein